MTKKSGEDELLIRYLLGQATEEEQLRLEQQFFTDEDRYQQLLALEDELKYEYAQGGLTPQQRKSFEKRFLVTEADRQKVALAKAVLAKANEVRAETAAASTPARAERIPWWRSFANFLTLPSPGMRLAFNSAGLLVLAGGLWFMFQNAQLRNQVGQLQAERNSAELTAQQQIAANRTQQEQLDQALAQERARRGELEKKLAERQTPSTLLSFLLAPGLSRGDDDGPKRLVIPSDAGTVRLQLDVKSKTPFKNYEARLQDLDGNQIWSQKVSGAIVEIPARLLPRGDYVIALKGITPQGEPVEAGEFYFSTIRK
jgi:hypothetical protein